MQLKLIQSSITAQLLQQIAVLPTGRFHITLSHMKNPPAPFVKILWQLVLFLYILNIFGCYLALVPLTACKDTCPK